MQAIPEELESERRADIEGADAASPPGTPPIRSATILEIESLRGVAIALVYVFHAYTWILFQHPPPGTAASPAQAVLLGGHTGVSLFFVLSGFLLGRPFLREAFGGRRVGRATYYARRALRILPLYVVTVLVAAAACAERVSDLLHALPYLAFLQALPGAVTPLVPFSSVWWSLATEVQFYLLLPLLPWCFRSRRGRWLGSLVASVYVAAYVGFCAQWWSPATLDGRVRLCCSLFGRAPLFVSGIVAGGLFDRWGGAVRAWCTRTRWIASWGGALCLTVVLASGVFLLQQIAELGYLRAETDWVFWHIAEGGVWVAVLLLLLLVPVRMKPLLCNRCWGTLGRLSYSVYMVHLPMIVLMTGLLSPVWPGRFIGWHTRTVAGMALVSVACVAVSGLSYGLIERPFLRRKVRLEVS